MLAGGMDWADSLGSRPGLFFLLMRLVFVKDWFWVVVGKFLLSL